MKTEELKITREDFDLLLAERRGGENADQPQFYDGKELACRLLQCRQRNAELKRFKRN